VLDLMIHDIDLVMTLVGCTGVSEVRRWASPVLTPSVDIANARLTFESGAVANDHRQPGVARAHAQDPPLPAQRLPVARPRGGDGEFYRVREDVDPMALAAAPQELEAFVERVPLRRRRVSRCAWSSVLRRCGAGGAPVVVTGEDGREALDSGAADRSRGIEARLRRERRDGACVK
jgi:predicted dehydrogenase